MALFSVMEEPPAVAASEADAPQLLITGETGSANSRFAGSSSVNEAWVKGFSKSLFLIVMVNRLVSPIRMVVGAKLLLREGACTVLTFNVALAGVVFVIRFPAPVEPSAPAGIVLMRFPGVVEVTSTETVQDPGVVPTCAGTVPRLNDKVVVPAAPVTVPPQLFVKLTGFASESPG